ncbi:tubulin binding cofactor C-domain-containing protein [Echria macrotheca]|uniref:Tubulin binding cofactor C-domain-containing protein n=1 Tax=Echria macrotheca TaxID=438768 RepID=A0AAJ0F352_9PEZI|nr:tubulin binding cofactor C-domain-containing protein [Echria macrotheca]
MEPVSNQVAKERFEGIFHTEVAHQRETIDLIRTCIAGPDRQDAMDAVLSGVSRLTQAVADAQDFLAPYEVKRCTETLNDLTAQVKAEREKDAAKARFKFRPVSIRSPEPDSRKNVRFEVTPATATEANGVSNTPSVTGAQKGNGATKESTAPTRSDVHLFDRRQVIVVLPPPGSLTPSSGTVTDLQGCIVDLSVRTRVRGGVPFANLVLKDIRDSIIVSGIVDGSVHITGVRNSKLVVVARQIRIHECENVDIYLHCLSHPIIEDSKGMRFAPAPAKYLSEKHEKEVNQWDQVDDFKWLKADHSPNWSILPEEERLGAEAWNKTLQGEPHEAVEDILKKMGVEPTEG